MTEVKPPDAITVEFLHPNDDPIRYEELGQQFMSGFNIPVTSKDKPFQITVNKKFAKETGNLYYDGSWDCIPLPDRLETHVKIEGNKVPMSKIYQSGSGNPQRKGEERIQFGDLTYEATIYLTESKSPFYIYIHAHKSPDHSVGKAQNHPRNIELKT